MTRSAHENSKASLYRNAIPRGRSGFSLVELIVVLAITSVLIGLLMPGLRAARESARRLMCASNERQIGVGFAIFAKDQNERMPESWRLGRGDLTEMMSLSTGEKPPEDTEDLPDRSTFEGLGWLLPLAGGYVDSKTCFYCPSHCGDHNIEKYDGMFHCTDRAPVYCNYHYTGHQRRVTDDQGNVTLERRIYGNGQRQVLLTDGLRVRNDFSHGSGMNVLYADGSVEWHADTGNEIFNNLPLAPDENGVVVQQDHVRWVWDDILNVQN